MNKSLIMVIFGASGSGKTTLMEQLIVSGGQYSIHKKTTSRLPRQYDDIEIICTDNFLYENFDYVYQTYGHKYGIERKQINTALKNNQHHFIICNDISTIKSLKRDYGDIVKVIYHYFDAPQDAIEKIQRQRNISDDEVFLRITKINILNRTFIENYDLFDGRLVNKYKDEPEILKVKIEEILTQFIDNKIDDIEDLKRRILDSTKLENKSCNTQKNYAFIIMPIRDDDYENEDTHDAIKRCCNKLNINAERVDDVQYTGAITEKIQGCIKVSEFIIADLTHERPNVYYEIGYADAYNKPLILIAKLGTKIHFDIQGMNVKFYKGMKHLEEELEKSIASIRKL